MAKKLNHHIYQDKVSGVWYFQKKVKIRPGPYKFSLQTISVVEARRRRDRLLNEIAIYGDIRKPETPPEEIEQIFFGKVAQQWAAIKKTQVSQSTFREYRKTLNKHVLPVYGNRPINSINSLEIESFQSKLKCSGKTKRNIMTPFKNIMKFAKKHKIISYNPMDDVDGVRVPGIYQSRKRLILKLLKKLRNNGGGGGSRTYGGPYSHKGLQWFTECLPNIR